MYGGVRDSSGAVLPGATVSVTNAGTNFSRTALTDERGEFAMVALPVGVYTVRIEMPGFKSFTNAGLQLGAGQAIRQTFTLEVGQLTENVTVSATVPLLEAATAAQQESLGVADVTQLPLARRNLTNVMELSAGVTMRNPGMGGNGIVRLNGVGEGGTMVTVDGTNAAGNPETGALDHYGGQAQISVMSIEAVSEVQIVKGVLPAEYGGATGGQVNMISRSGTNEFHGSVLENYQHDALFAKNAFLTAQPKPRVRFNQFGGSLGGPVVRDRVFFFGAYEGYRENAGVEVQGNVPTELLRSQVLAANPSRETEIVLSALPLPNESINANVGRWRGLKTRTRRDNHILAKGDVRIKEGSLSVTFTRMRPYTDNPSVYVGPGNNQKFLNQSDRIATQYVLARGSWVSESRFGWNRNQLDRAQDFWFAQDPSREPETEITNAARRVGLLQITGLFDTASAEVLHMEGRSWSAEQKLSHITGPHNLKFGFRWARQGGQKTNPQNPTFTFQSLADFQANRPNTVSLLAGQPPHAAHLDDWGFFIQNDWRINSRLVLNLGLRYDYYPVFQVKTKSNAAAELYNLSPPTDLRLMDFGAARETNKPYDADPINFGPRAGFAWTVTPATVIRGGVGLLHSQHHYAVLQNLVANPFVPNRVTWNRTEAASRNLRWPMYSDALSAVALQDAGGKKIIFGLVDTDFPAPYTVQSMINLQRSFGSEWMAEIGYVRTGGRNFPLSRNLAQAFDRVTGERPNPALGSPAGYYVTAEQTMDYSAMQSSIRKRFGNSLGLDVHYTLAKGRAHQGGNLSSNFVNLEVFVTQDFWNPDIDRSPIADDTRHRMTASVVYEAPWFRNTHPALQQAFGGWQLSGIFRARSGVPLRITQPSGMPNSRPDYIGEDAVFDNWGDTLMYIDRRAFALVSTSPVTQATIRAGTYNPDHVRGPAVWSVDMSLSKTFRFKESVSVQIRADAFNAFNHVNYNNPTTSISSPTFGQITGAAAARTGQVGAKLTF
jgi:hypothetical protein